MNVVFTNPNILKIAHGCSQDIVWLQRDFDIFVVNLFDTQQACRALNHSKTSLDSLVERYLKIYLDKFHQLSDWRQRPLPSDMIQYARCDSHYLLPLFDHIIADLYNAEQPKLIKTVFENCKKMCLKLYTKPNFDKQGFSTLRKDWHMYDCIRNECFLELCKWRDDVARRLDESPQSIDFIIDNIKFSFLFETESCLSKIREIILKYQKKQSDIIEANKSWDISPPQSPNEKNIFISGFIPVERTQSHMESIFSQPKCEGFRLYKTNKLDPIIKPVISSVEPSTKLIQTSAPIYKKKIFKSPTKLVMKMGCAKSDQLKPQQTQIDKEKKINTNIVTVSSDPSHFDYSSFNINQFST
ncbi:hypothetical protein MXB_4891, partial [Myxobolus squamalis]